MRIKFRRIKDRAMLPVHASLSLLRWLPESVTRVFFAGVGLIGKSLYFLPGSHVRRTSAHMAKACGRQDPRRMFFSFTDNIVHLLNLYGLLLRGGGERVARRFRLSPEAERTFADVKARHGKAIVLVPHCVGSVLSAAGFGHRFPSIVLLRESKNPRRSEILKQYMERLGPEMFYARRTDRSTLTRGILRALREEKFIVGTTDLIRQHSESVQVRVFGQPVWVDSWPVRFSSRRQVPIVPAYVVMDAEGITMHTGTPYQAGDDEVAASQQWADYFEACFKRFPSDWAFQFDKRWAAVLAAAAGEPPRLVSRRSRRQGRQ